MVIIFSRIPDNKELQKLFILLTEFEADYIEAKINGSLYWILKKDLTEGEKNQLFDSFSFIAKIQSISSPFKLVSSELKKETSVIAVGDQLIGDGGFNIAAGPCAVESEEQIFSTAKIVSELGIPFLRGGAFKPRTSPYSFQGLQEEGLKLIRRAADEYGLLVVTEVMDNELIDLVSQYSDILQVGSRNMQNYYFLKKLGEAKKPILLKRGMSASITEWLLAAEYIVLNGNEQVVLCERGIRTFDDIVRNTMDIAAIALIKELSHLPVWADPSQGTGVRKLVEPLSKAALAAGADGLMVEVHPDPDSALSDGDQSIAPDQLRKLIESLSPLAEGMNKNLYLSPQNIL